METMNNPTPAPTKFKLQTQARLAKRISELCHDGYTIVVASVSITLTVYKLRHRMNGNTITIIANPLDDFMIQKSNGVTVYQGKIQP